MIEAYTPEGELIERRYARNRKTADKIARHIGDLAEVRPLNKYEWSFINPEWVEG
jgi:hypothetical protein